MPCEIEDTVCALEEAIKYKKMAIQDLRVKAANPAVAHMFSEMVSRASGPYTQFNHLFEQGIGSARNFLESTQQQIKEKPWEALRQVAVYSFAVGFFLSVRRRKSTTREKA